MKQKSILITGCSTGIGYATAIHLAKQKWQVIATVRNPQDGIALQQAGCIVELLDVRDQITQQQLFNKYPHLDAVFLNAGLGLLAAVEDCSDEALRFQFDSNFFSTWQATRLAIQNMRAHGNKGHIIICSSVVGYVSLAYRGAYVASKYALEGMVESARLELKDSQIEICSLNPGPILSQFRFTSQKISQQYVDFENSIHKEHYQQQYQRLSRPAVANDARGTLPAEDCALLVEKILGQKHTKAKYLITKLAKRAYFAKKLLPYSWLEKILVKL